MPPPKTPTEQAAEPLAEGCAARVTWEAPEADPATSYEILAMPTRTRHSTPSSPITIRGLESGATYTFEIVAVAAAGKSSPATTGPVEIRAKPPSRWWSLSSWAFTVVVLISGMIWLIFAIRGSERARSLAVASLLLIAVSTILQAIDHRYGIWRPIIGTDRRVSTSQLQTFMWTLLIAFLLAYFVSRTWLDREPDLFKGFVPGEQDSKATAWDDYLILLGGPFVALVAAKGITTAKMQNGVIQKSVADDGAATIRQAVTNDAGKIDLVDTQYLIFNLVALTYVIFGFATSDKLPAVPGLLLALTGSSAAAYVLNKSVQSNAPAITSVTPSSFRPGECIVINGANFRPGGVVGPPTVTIGGKQAVVEASTAESENELRARKPSESDASITNTRLVVHAPIDASAGVHDLVVTSAIRISTQPTSVRVLPDRPIVISIDPPSPSRGRAVTITGTGFTDLETHTSRVNVQFGSILVEASASRIPAAGVEQIMVNVPTSRATRNTQVDLTVQTARLTVSEPVRVTIR